MTTKRSQTLNGKQARCGPKPGWFWVVLAVLLFPSRVNAHDWYPAWCCNDKDCRALSEEKGETVVEEPDGWHLWDGRVAGRDSAKTSPDTKFHLCDEPTTKAIICFFVPPGSS